jgi:hypothetical protein
LQVTQCQQLPALEALVPSNSTLAIAGIGKAPKHKKYIPLEWNKLSPHLMGGKAEECIEHNSCSLLSHFIPHNHLLFQVCLLFSKEGDANQVSPSFDLYLQLQTVCGFSVGMSEKVSRAVQVAGMSNLSFLRLFNFVQVTMKHCLQALPRHGVDSFHP